MLFPKINETIIYLLSKLNIFGFSFILSHIIKNTLSSKIFITVQQYKKCKNCKGTYLHIKSLNKKECAPQRDFNIVILVNTFFSLKKRKTIKGNDLLYHIQN